jgi:hypothetical protein
LAFDDDDDDEDDDMVRKRESHIASFNLGLEMDWVTILE